jgi:hypothetical protein
LIILPKECLLQVMITYFSTSVIMVAVPPVPSFSQGFNFASCS